MILLVTFLDDRVKVSKSKATRVMKSVVAALYFQEPKT